MGGRIGCKSESRFCSEVMQEQIKRMQILSVSFEAYKYIDKYIIDWSFILANLFQLNLKYKYWLILSEFELFT